VLVTADHGEGLGEHREDTHGVFVYDATLRVPLVVAGPGVPEGRVVGGLARLVDVAPTLLELAGLGPLPGADGRSLAAAARGAAPPEEPAYSESLFASVQLGWAPLHAIRTARYKVIDAPEPELYDLAADAGETRNLFAQRRDVADPLLHRLHAALAVPAPDARLAATRDVSERLQALGYLGGAAPARPTLRDPKQAIGLLLRLERGLAEARSDPALAMRELDAVLAEEPDMPLARRYRAIARQGAGRYEGAIADLRALESQGTLAADDAVLMAETLRLARRYDEALEALDRAARADPSLPEPALIRARVLRAAGRPNEAAEEYQRALGLVPGNLEAERGLAELAIERGALAEAEPRLDAILKAAPEDVGALLKLGVVRVRSGRVDEAIALFRKAVALAPSNPEALLDLAGALAKSGRPGEAVPYFEQAVRAGGDTTLALNGLGLARLESGDTAGALRALRQSLAREAGQAHIAEIVAQLSRGGRP
jgi:tetratricopeptide (TPR) repeat protein